VAYTKRLCPNFKGVLFSGLRYIKGKGNLSFRYLKRPLIKNIQTDAPYAYSCAISFLNPLTPGAYWQKSIF